MPGINNHVPVCKRRAHAYFKSMRNFFIAAILVSLFTLPVICQGRQAPEGWTHFRGPNGNGVVTDPNIPEGAWQNVPRLLWMTEIGEAFSEIAVCDNVIYTMFSEKTDSVSGTEYVAAYDSGTGQMIWQTALDKIFIDADDWGDGPRATPAVDQNNVYCFSGQGKLAAIAKQNGQILWEVSFTEHFGSTLPRWGFASSPRIVDEMVVIETGGTGAQLVTAFNKNDGKVIWSNGTGDAAYSSAIVAKADEREQILFANGATLYAFDAQGDTLWTFGMPLRSPMASPLFIEPDNVFLSATNGEGGFLIKVSDNKPELLLTTSQMKNDWSSSFYSNGHIYGFNVAALQCVSLANGVRKWTKRGYGKGSLIMVNDKMIILSDQGQLAIAEVSHDAYNEISSIQALDGRCWTAPSYHNGRIYVRNLTHMACFDLVGSETGALK